MERLVMPMSTLFCNFGPGFGLQALNQCLSFRQKHTARSSYIDSKESSCFRTNAQKFFHMTYRRHLEFYRRRRNPIVLFNCKEKGLGTTFKDNIEDDVPMETLIWRAIKLPIYSVALVPLMVGSAAAYFQAGVFSARIFFILLASSVLIISWLNLSNDAYDFSTGADKNKKESVVSLVGSHTGTLVAAYSFLALGFMGLVFASVEAGNMRSILLLACAITCGYIYQCPPFRLSYHGLGEPLCFSSFGPFATNAFYLLQSNTRDMGHLPMSSTILSASLLVGFTTTLILFCSHFHQIEGDRAVGKISPLVRIGTERGSGIVNVAVVALYVLLFALGLSKCLPYPCLFLCALTIPIGKLVVSFVEENKKDKSKIYMAKYYCVRLHALFGAALAAGLIAARLLTNVRIGVLLNFRG